jgi:hypothetical protein
VELSEAGDGTCALVGVKYLQAIGSLGMRSMDSPRIPKTLVTELGKAFCYA